MENLDNSRPIDPREAPLLPGPSGQRALPMRHSLRKTVLGMRALETSYESAVRAFQRRYIIEVLIMHGCHLGKAAKELDMHRNTLARIIREFQIDVKQIRNIPRKHPLLDRG